MPTALDNGQRSTRKQLAAVVRRLSLSLHSNLTDANGIPLLSALVLLAGERKSNAAFALADLLSRRGLERPCETLVAWARGA